MKMMVIFCYVKKIALEDINLDIELNDPELKPISKTEINNYIYYYNNERLQSKLKGMTPIEYRNHSYNAIYF